MRNYDSSFGPAASSFLLGLAAGSAVALLFTPYSGDETRRRLNQGVSEGKEKVMKTVNEGKKRVTDQASRIGSAVQAGKEAFSKDAYNQA